MSQEPKPEKDEILQCKDCGAQFTWTVGEQRFFAIKGFTPPTRCKDCRERKKAQRQRGARD
jgi:hypothetical protein